MNGSCPYVLMLSSESYSNNLFAPVGLYSSSSNNVQRSFYYVFFFSFFSFVFVSRKAALRGRDREEAFTQNSVSNESEFFV